MADQRKPPTKVVYLPGCKPGAPPRLRVEHEGREGGYHYVRFLEGDRLLGLFSCLPGRDGRRVVAEILRLEASGELERLPEAGREATDG